jgi:hypothetical protein
MTLRLVGVLTILAGFAPAIAPAQSAKPSEPDDVYRGYLASIKALQSLDDRSFEIYLSKTARLRMADYRAHPAKKTCDVCPSPEQELRMAKTMRPFPGASVRSDRRDSGGIASLTYKWREPAGSQNGIGTEGTDITVKVELVQEQGWKLKRESWVMTEVLGTMTANGSAVWSY